jgi:dTDP-4-dehydrorhamnose reductase
MTRPRILLIGPNGQVGWELQRTLAPLAEVVCAGRPEVDVTGEDALRSCVRATRPQVILNAGAYTAVDKAESEPEAAMLVNGVAPGILAEEARDAGAWLVHYSTDYVFDGSKAAPYVETDAPRPLGVYGRTKLAGEEAVARSGAKHLMFRLCWVYGTRGRNFLLTIQRLAREREQLRVVSDQVGCPTWSRLIAETTAHALRQALTADEPARYAGTYHLAASGCTSWHGFAHAIVQRMPVAERKCTVVDAIATHEYPLVAARPKNSVLNCDKLESTFGLRLPEWEEGLQMAMGK